MKILLVDDSKSARYALRLQLQRHGVEVETADSAESAFELLKGELPDAILMDHLMPGLNGFEALEVIREDPRTAHLPVVMCTSHEEADFAAAAKRNGVVGILPKSMAPEKLPDILAQLREVIAGIGSAPAAKHVAPIELPPAPAPAAAAVPAPLRPAEPLVAAEPPGLTEARVTDLIDTRVGGLVDSAMDERIEARLGRLLTPMLEDLRRDLTERLTAEVKRMVGESSAEARRLVEESSAETRGRLDAGLAEVRELKAKAALDTEAFEAATSRMAQETLPDMIKLEIEAERGQIMDLVEQYLREFGPTASTAPAPSPESSAATIESALSKAADIARRESREIVDPALDRANRIADTVLAQVRSGAARMYAASAAAAVIGIAAAAAVYFLLR